MTRILARPSAGNASGPLARDWRECAARLEQPLPAQAQAATILLGARKQARAIIAAAHATGQEVAAAERRQSWEQGYADGLAQGQQEGDLIAQRLAALVANAAVAHEESRRNLHQEALALVMALTRAVVKHEVRTAPDTVLAVVQAALAEMSVEASVRVRVHPDDAEVVQAHLPLPGLPPSIHVAAVADAAIAPGGCVVESGAGCVDATLERQLARIEDLLHDHLLAS